MFSSTAPSFSRGSNKSLISKGSISNKVTDSSNIALKRKRDDIIAPRSAPNNRGGRGGGGGGGGGDEQIKELANVSHIFNSHSSDTNTDNISTTSTSTSTTRARLLSNGDMILLSDSKMSLVMNSLNHSKATVVNVLSEQFDVRDLERGLGMSVGVGAARGLIGSSTEGAVLLYTVEADGSVTSSQRGVTLGDDTDSITCVLHAGDCYVVGTMHGDLYVIRHETGAGNDSVLFMERLRRSQGSVFMGLFQTGVKMLGLGGEGRREGGEVRRLLVSEGEGVGGAYDKLLFALSDSSLSLWTAWTQPGEEQLLWDVKVRDMLHQGISQAVSGAVGGDVSARVTDGDSSSLTILDVQLLPSESESSCGILLVLSTYTDSSSSTHPSLWLHVVAFSSTPYHPSKTHTPRNKNIPGPLSVRGRLRVGGVLAAVPGVRAMSVHRAMLHRVLLPQSWRLYISWTSATSRTVRVTHIDVKNLPDLSDSEYAEEQRETDSSDVGSEDTFIRTEDVLSCSSVTGQEGVCLLLKDGTVRLSAPPLQQRNNRVKFNLKLSHSALSPEQSQAHSELLEEGACLLMSVAQGEESLNDIAARLKIALTDSSEDDLSDMVVRVSNKILNRASTGQNWGLLNSGGDKGMGSGRGLGMGSGSGGTGRGRAQCQLARRNISDKLGAHTQLLDVVHETGIFDVMLPGQINALSRNHQQLLGSGGLCAALEEAQQRVGGDTPAISTDTSSNPTVASGPLGSLSPINPLSPLFLTERGTGGVGNGAEDDANPSQERSSERSTSLRTANVQFLYCASKEGLRVVSLGMERAVKQAASRSDRATGVKDDLASKGLSTADAFFSEAVRFSDGLLCISSVLRDERVPLSNRGALLVASYGVISCLLAAVQACQGEAGGGEGGLGGMSYLGSRNPAAALACDEQVNKAILEVISIFTAACEALVASGIPSALSSSGLTQSRGFGQGLTLAGNIPSGAQLEGYFEGMGLGRVQEGRRLKALCSAVLSSHVLRAGVSSDRAVGGVGVSEAWREGFAQAKSCCIGSLLQVGHTLSAFDLSAQFLHPRGLLEALDLAECDAHTGAGPNTASASSASSLALSLTARFRDIIRKKGSIYGTEAVPLCTYCMQWLEAKGRPVSVLDIGKLAPDQLNAFLECRPHISWVHRVSTQSYAAAATAAVEHGYRETRHATASTLLSMAKMSAMLSSSDTQRSPSLSSSSFPPSASTIPSSSFSSSSSATSAPLPLPPSSSSLWEQREVRHVCVSGSDAAREATANLSVLRAQQTVILEGDTNLLRDCGDVCDRLHASVIIDKLILLAHTRGAGLNMESGTRRGELHVEGDIAASASAVADTVRYLSMAIGQLSMRKDCLEAMVRSGEAAREGIERGLSIAESQLREVWATALRVQECLWVNLAAASYEKEQGADISLGVEENIMFGTVLGLLSIKCRQSVREELLRGDVCPSIGPRDTSGAGEQDSIGAAGVDLDSVIDTLSFSDTPHADRVAYLIRGCLSAGTD